MLVLLGLCRTYSETISLFFFHDAAQLFTIFSVLLLISRVQLSAKAACDYASLTTDLNACVVAASGTATTKWAFPVGSIAEQATICSNLESMNNCTKNIFTACKNDAKSLKMFNNEGLNIDNAYTALCNSAWFTEATACMSSNNNAADITTFTTTETAFSTDVDALNSAASATEICGLATTMVYTAYYDLLTEKCDTASHLQVWRDFYDVILDTYACSSCTSSAASRFLTNYWHLNFRMIHLISVPFMWLCYLII